MGECRAARGWRAGNDSIWARISGEALSRTQRSPSTLTATLSCVRGRAAIVPARMPRQFGHPQFHWGNPPPAAEPSTWMRTAQVARRTTAPRSRAAQTRRAAFMSSGGRSRLEAVVRLPLEIVLVRVDLRRHVDLLERRG